MNKEEISIKKIRKKAIKRIECVKRKEHKAKIRTCTRISMTERDLIEKKLIAEIGEINEKISKFSTGRNEAIAKLQTIFWAINWFCMKQEVENADEESIEICDNCWKALKGIGSELLIEKLETEKDNEEKVKMLLALALIEDGNEEKWLEVLEDLKLQECCEERELKKYRSIIKPFFGDEFWLEKNQG